MKWPNIGPPTQEHLRDALPDIVGRLSVAQLVVMDQPELSDGIDRYGLVPIIGITSARSLGGQLASGLDWEVPGRHERIKMGYLGAPLPDGGRRIGMPYIDGNCGIGLTYQPPRVEPAETRLVAVTSVESNKRGVIDAIQIQAAWTVSESRKSDSGLWGGFNWKKLLVRGLIEVGEEIGFKEIVVAGYKGGRLVDEQKATQWMNAYDNTAQELGFRIRSDGNWVLRLAKRK